MSTDLVEKTVVMTDVAGFTQMMRANERQTLALLQVDIEIIKNLFAANLGEIVKIAGDGILALFPSPTHALIACQSVQKELANSSLKHRMAIHVGNVTMADGDVYGDTVNVCARLEALATPGTIIMSNTAALHIQGVKLELPSVSGKVRLKGIEGKVLVHCYGKNAQLPKQKNRLTQIVVIVAIVAIGASWAGWSASQRTTIDDISTRIKSHHTEPKAANNEAQDIDELLDQAFDDLWQEIDAYEAVKEEAILKVDADMVIDWLNKNPLGQRERGKHELEIWQKIKVVIDEGRTVVGKKATADQIWAATFKNPKIDEASRKAFAQEFRKPT